MLESTSPGVSSLQDTSTAPQEDLVRVEHLKKYFPIQTGFLATLLTGGQVPSVKAVDDVTFSIRKGEVFGLAGESGAAPLGSDRRKGILRGH
jgi:ABC-type glutathione transport system ATPase component